VRILEPKKERGTATLKANEDLFSYLSKTGRTVKITGAMMGGSWMGSHFTNDDLVKSTRLRDEFKATVSEGPTVEGSPTYKLVLIPNPDTVVVWGQIDITVRKSDLLPVDQLFYDEDGAPARKMEFREYRQIGERATATRITMTPLDKPNEFTEIRYAKLEFDVGLDENYFTLQRLKSM
ncbi:MAG: outer membrane lipoprotein-sorting protein, partial [Nannocystaceae bacterium]